MAWPERAPVLCQQEAWREARGSDVMDRDGLVSVRRSSGEWLFLQQGPNSKAFVLEGEFGERFQLQTDKEVGPLPWCCSFVVHFGFKGLAVK